MTVNEYTHIIDTLVSGIRFAWIRKDLGDLEIFNLYFDPHDEFLFTGFRKSRRFQQMQNLLLKNRLHRIFSVECGWVTSIQLLQSTYTTVIILYFTLKLSIFPLPLFLSNKLLLGTGILT